MKNFLLSAVPVFLVCAFDTSFAYQSSSSSDEYLPPQLEEVHVDGRRQSALETHGPSTAITAVELEAINTTTVEDAIGYEPNLLVRRRYIGDANGSVGIRGSNMFQTARTLVYADGLPLHYHLQTRWSGAPRWSLVSPEEVAAVDVIYGPFSAAYSGNAMGGVIQVTTATPAERTFAVRGALFDQHYQELSTDEHYSGGRLALSYGDALGDWSLFGSYNRLDNEGQPMSQFFAASKASEVDGTAVTGAILGKDAQGRSVFYYGDSGAEQVKTDLVKLKTRYSGERVQFTGTLAYEDRQSETDAPKNFLRTAEGEPFWRGTAMVEDQAVSLNPANFAVQAQQRRSLLAGAAVTAPLAKGWSLDLNLSRFEILEDESSRSQWHPEDPAFTPLGRVTDFHDTGWTTADVLASGAAIAGAEDTSVGAHYSTYCLGLRSFDSDDFANGAKTQLRSTSGGKTETGALFAESTWQLHALWQVTLGARYEYWRTTEGFTDDTTLEARTEQGLSPKLSLQFAPVGAWVLRYSLARALRFPLVEELYQNESRATAVQTANAQLQPEEGLHHNFMLEKSVQDGFVRVNLFRETIEDTIFNQFGIVDGVEVTTFLGVDEVTTHGAELIFNQRNLWRSPIDIRFNLSYLDPIITRNSFNPAIEGNVFPRLPRWQSNALLTYRPNGVLSLSGGLRYASNSYGELDNSDTASRTFGAHDDYLFFNLKSRLQVTQALDFAVGVDNLTNETAYVHHPWPSRTAYLEAGYVF